jgi:hypothetical protein
MATTVNLLMFLPLNDLKVVVTLYAVHLQWCHLLRCKNGPSASISDSISDGDHLPDQVRSPLRAGKGAQTPTALESNVPRRRFVGLML